MIESNTADNFLTAFTSATGLKTTYGYDALNRRTLKDSKDKTETFLYDGIKVLQEQTTGPKPQVALYSRTKGRLLAKQIYPDQPGSQTTPESLFYHHDALGSIIGLTDSNSKLITRYRYDAFGKLLAGDTSKNQYTFTGKRLDPESGLYHFHFRQYDAEVGVWTTPDPIGILGGVNLYQYALNNPVNFRDLLGLWDANGGDADNDANSQDHESGSEDDGLGNTHDSGDSENESHEEGGFWEGFWSNLETQANLATTLSAYVKIPALTLAYGLVASIATTVNLHFYSETPYQDVVQTAVLGKLGTSKPMVDYTLGEIVDVLTDEKNCTEK